MAGRCIAKQMCETRTLTTVTTPTGLRQDKSLSLRDRKAIVGQWLVACRSVGSLPLAEERQGIASDFPALPLFPAFQEIGHFANAIQSEP
jgi:hypothetical protein